MNKKKDTKKKTKKLDFEAMFDATPVKRGDGTTTTKGTQTLFENPVKEIVIRPDYAGSALTNVRDFAIKLLEGYIWACEHDPRFIAVHFEVIQAKRVLYGLSYLKAKEDNKEWVPNETEELQLLLIDFIRLLPALWD